MDMDEFFSDENIVILKPFAGMAAVTRMELFGVLNDYFIDAQNLVEQNEQKRIARENDFA